jgi:hypothetical protein
VDAFELKRLTQEGVPGALEKARHYRLLNEPGTAESICRDILQVDPDHRDGRVLLLLALTDQFGRGLAERYDEALSLCQAFPDPYQRAYYTGIVQERRAKAHHRAAAPGSGTVAREWFRAAMASFEEAERLRPQGDDSSILRWNSCARRLMAHGDLHPTPEDHDHPPVLGE